MQRHSHGLTLLFPPTTPSRKTKKTVEAFALSNAAPLLLAALDDAGPPSPPPRGAPPPLPPPSPSASASASTPAPARCPLCLRGIKLLSVESARAFYAANGFSEPDAHKEMFKALSRVRRGLLRAK